MATVKINELTDATSASSTAEIPIYDGGTKRITRDELLEIPAWDDLTFPFTSTRRGTTNKPDFDYTNVGLLFPQNDTSEVIYIVGQLPHSWKEGTELHPHIHWRQTSAQLPVWKMDYKWISNGEVEPANFTTVSASAGEFTYTSGNMVQISAFPAIVGTGKKISSMLLIKLYRDDNVVTGDVLAYEYDIHYQVDAFGSTSEYVK